MAGGIIRSWQRPRDVRFDSKPAKVLEVPDRYAYQAWTLALSPDEKTLVSAGQFKRLVLWNVATSEPRQLRLLDRDQNRGENDFFWDVSFAPNSSILAASDSDGYITFLEPKSMSKDTTKVGERTASSAKLCTTGEVASLKNIGS